MVIRKTLNNTELRQLKDHLENTAWELIKWYTLTQLSLMDWKDTRTVRNSWDYLPIRVDNSKSLTSFKAGNQKKPYMTLYIRVDEIKQLFNKRNKRKKLIIE